MPAEVLQRREPEVAQERAAEVRNQVKPVALTTDFLGHGRPMDRFVPLMADAGFKRALWCENWDGSYKYTPAEVAKIDRTFQSLGLQITQVHSSEGGIDGDPDKPNYGQWVSPDEIERQKGLALIRNRIQMAHDLGASVVTVHAPHHEMSWPGGPKAWQESMYRSLSELQQEAMDANVRIGLENTDWSGPGKFDNFPPIVFALGKFGPEFLGITYDSGHGNVLSGQLDMLDQHSDRLIDTHIHDNAGDGAVKTGAYKIAPDRKNQDDDMHRMLFSGTVDVVKFAQIMARGDAPITSEASQKYDSELDPMVWLALERRNLEAFQRMVEAIRSGAPIDVSAIANRRVNVLRGVLQNPVGEAPKSA